MIKFALFLLVATSLFGEGKRVVIGGAGPVGLYAAARLHEEGYDVTLLSDRKEYTRLQIAGLAPPWVEFLKRFANDGFQRMVKQGRARMTKTGSVEMILSDLEKILFEQLVVVAKRSPRLHLMKETPLEEIAEIGEEAFARSGDLLIPFDLLLFAGGTKDALCAFELSVPVSVHEPVPFSIEMFQKGPSKRALGISEELQARLIYPDLQGLGEALRQEVCRMAEIDVELARLYGYFAHHLATEVTSLDTRFFENSVEVAVAIEWGHPFFVSMFRLMRMEGFSREAVEAQERFFALIHHEVVEAVLRDRGVPEQLSPIEVTRFFVQQTRLAEAERTLARSGSVLFAVGDALVTPHFFSRGGLESGRLAVENVYRRYTGGDKESFEKARLALEKKALDFGCRPCTKPRPTAEERRLAYMRAEEPFKRQKSSSWSVTGKEGHYVLHLEGEKIPFEIEFFETEDPLYPYELHYVAGGEVYQSFGALLRR